MALVEEIVHNLSVKSVLIFLGIGFALWKIYLRIDEAVRLRRLGGARANEIPSWLPFGEYGQVIGGIPPGGPPGEQNRNFQLNLHPGFETLYRQFKGTMENKNYDVFRSFLNAGPDWTVETTILGQRSVATADPENIKTILATQFHDFGKGEPFHRIWSEFLGDSIFTTDGQQWHDSRHLIRTMFIKERISDLHCFESHLETLFKAIANGGALDGEDQEVDIEAGNGKPVDISELFFRYTLDVTTDFLLGKDIKSLT